MELHPLIQKIESLYLPLSDACKAELLSRVELCPCTKDEVLVREGQIFDRIFYIHQGCARAYYLKEGKDISDWFALEGEFIVSIDGFFRNAPSLHYIQVLEDSMLLSLSKNHLLELSDKYREVERLEKMVITQTLLKLQQRIVSLQFETARQKYENLLAQIPHIEQRVPLTHIASYLGITLETLSRIRKPQK